MTNTISEDALQGQQSRIMNALRANAAPTQQQISPQDLMQAIQAGNKPGGDYLAALKAAQTAQAQGNLAAETGIYEQMKAQAARGNEQASAIDKAIIDVAGDDPKLYSSIAEDLHKDPETITGANARSKVMMYAAQRGIVPLTTQKSKADIAKVQADTTRAIKESNKATGGATGEMVDRIKKDNPGWTDTDALYFLQTGARKGTKLDENGNIVSIGGALKTAEDTKKAEKRGTTIGEFEGKAITDLPRIEQQTNDALDLVSKLGKHPGLSQAVGLSSTLPIIPGTQAADFMAVLDQIHGANFLQAYNQLRGGGQITEIEGKKAENAIARLQRSQSEPAFKQSLKDLSDVLQKGLERAKKSTNIENIPDGGKVTPKRLKYNPTTGEFE